MVEDPRGGPATTGGKVGRRPQDILPIAFLNIRPLDTEQPTGNAFETVDHARHRVLRRVVDEQGYVFGLTVHLDELRLEVSANFLEHDFEPLDSASVKPLSSIFGDEYQVDMQCENAMPAVTNIA